MLDKVSSDNRVLNELWSLDSNYSSAETVVVTNFNTARVMLNDAAENLKFYETNTRKNIFTFFLDQNDAQAIKRDVESETGMLLKRILDGLGNLRDVHICANDKGQTIRVSRLDEFKLVKIVLRNDLDYTYILKEDYTRIFGSVTDKVYKTLFGQEVVKVSKYTVKDLDVEKFENDVSQDYRYSLLMANDIKPHDNYRTMVIDVETHGSVDIINTPKPLISATIHDNWTDKYYLYLFKPELEANIRFEKDGDYHSYYNSEKEMLTDIVKQVKETDVLSGWNINSFDILYLLRRYEKLGGRMTDVSLANKVRWNIKEDKDRFEERNFKVYGLDILDAMVLTKDITKFNLKKPENMALSTVGEFYLGAGQKKLEISSPSELWVTKQYDKLLEYNKHDVVLVVNIAKKLRLFEYYSNIKKIVPSVNMTEAQYNSVIIDKLLLTKFNHVVYPSKHWEEKIKIEGAYVSEPIPGIYNEVGVFDFNALYPNLIKSLNISPETIDPEGEVVIDDVRFTIKFKGILPQLVDFMMTMRTHYKKIMEKFPKNSPDYVIYDMIQTSVKAIVNSVYGVFLLPSFRLYSADIGKSITSAGRKTIQAAWKYVEENEKDFKPIYGDSVDGDTCIPVKIDGKFKVSRIKDLFEVYSKSIKSECGKEVIYLNSGELELLSFNFNRNRPEWKQVLRIIRHSTSKKLKIVTNKYNLFVVTEDHSFYNKGEEVTVNNFDWAWINKCEIVLDKSCKYQKIDLWKLIQNDVITYSQRLSTKVFKYEVDNNKIRVYFAVKTRGYVSKTGSIYDEVVIPRFIVLDEDFAALIGAYVAEGSVGCTNNKFRKYSNCRVVSVKTDKWAYEILEKAQKKFGKYALLVDKEDMKYVYFKSCIFALIFGNLCGAGSQNKHFPDEIFASPRNVIRVCIYNYCLRDGIRKTLMPDLSRGNAGGKSRLLVSQVKVLISNYLDQPEFTLSYWKNKNCYDLQWWKERNSAHNREDNMNRRRKCVADYNFSDGYVYDLEVEGNHNFVNALDGTILHNTDSLFVHHLHNYRENCGQEFIELEDRINKHQEEFLKANFCNFKENHMKLEVETQFKKLILSEAKKKYLGLAKVYKGVRYDEPTLAFRGFVLIRRDAPQAIKVVLQELVMILLKGTDKETVDAIKVAKDKLKLISWQELSIKKQINREIQDYKVVPQHVRAMQYSNKYLKTNFSKQNYAGGMLFILKCPPGFPATDVIAIDESVQDLQGFTIDYDKYWELFIKSPINLILSGQGARLFERNSLRKWITQNAVEKT